ncbi:expressed unknown protein [Seminavis robusta]|uniref:Transmembrane protein n=1 Tax=Seminavis robusta TaxID=568900 RepID=A0A9N8E0E4_9STRA|nr:expressed unknown protein [Seminavis robusta]|eukprot:Sro500_g155280.1 n/a (314) ;mRNA; r:30158-31099
MASNIELSQVDREFDFVRKQDDDVKSSMLHQKPPRHPRFSVQVKQHHHAHRYSTETPQAIQQQSSQRWSTVAGMIGPPRSDLAASMTATSPEGCEVCDQSGAVERYFASVRVPASFLAATSFTELFATSFNPDDSSIQRQLQLICLLCQGLSFVLSMNVIVLCSQALVRGLTGNFDPFSETGYEFLFREFHFEFVCVRWSFLVSCFGFLLAVTAKILYSFELFNFSSESYERNHLELGVGVCLVMASLMTHLASYVNSTMVGWKSMTDMSLDMIRMLVTRAKGMERPLEPFSLFMALIGVLFIILALIPGAQI